MQPFVYKFSHYFLPFEIFLFKFNLIMKTYTPAIKTMKALSLSIFFFLTCQATFGQTKNNVQSAPASTPPVTILKASETVVSSPDMSRNFNGRGQRVYMIGETEVKQSEILVPEVINENKNSTITAEPK